MRFRRRRNPNWVSNKSDWFRQYDEYRQSDAWKSIRASVLQRDNYRCRDCGGMAVLAHHLHYRNFKHELLADLVSLCKSCHDDIHHKR